MNQQPQASSTAASAIGPPSRRRNGRLQACEPCRKRKVSCDHTYPVCRRCRARDITDVCVYLTPRGTTTSSGSGGREPRPRRGARRVQGESLRNIETLSSPNGSGISSQANNSPEPTHSHGTPLESNPGYLGFTSFSAVFQETQNSLSLVQGGPIASSMGMTRSGAVKSTSGNGNNNNNTVVAAATTTPTLSPRVLETCVAVLRQIPREYAALPLFLKHTNPNDGWIRLAAQRMIDSLLAVFGRELRSRRLADLESMAHVLSANTARTWTDDESDVNKWLASFSGHNMRWECIGILFTYWGFGSLADHPHRPEISTSQASDPRGVLIRYKESAQLCVDLCKGSAPNQLLLYLMYKKALMESVVAGDASPGFWRHMGDVIATATYLGLHAYSSDESSYVPTASSEAKRRLVSQIFMIDKVAASFCGRPPLLSRKYMHTPLPLDLSDEVLLGDAESIARAVEKLDAQGWSQDGKFYSTTVLRARVLLMSVKDEVMEIALGNVMHTSIDVLLDLKARAYNVLSMVPTALRYDPDDVRDMTIPAPTLYAKAIIQIENLQNIFFALRLLVQRGHSSQADLLSISYEMVCITLIFWTHMDRLSGLHGDYEWLVMAYAAPAGGILCNELLNPTLHITPIPGLTKGNIIQKLSLLIGFLDWVNPSAPNGDLCMSCKAVIQHVLDLSLNGQWMNQSNSNDTENGFDINFDFATDMGGFFNFDLLDTYEWLRPDMISSQQTQQEG